MDYILNIYKNKKYIGTVGGSNMAYDNVLWWEINDIINLANCDEESLIKLITSKSEYWKEVKNNNVPVKDAGEIDLGLKTLKIGYSLILEDIDNVEDYEVIKKENSKYYICYEEDEYLLKEIIYKNEDILNKEIISFDDFEDIFKLVKYCLLDLKDADFVLNRNKFLKLTNI